MILVKYVILFIYCVKQTHEDILKKTCVSIITFGNLRGIENLFIIYIVCNWLIIFDLNLIESLIGYVAFRF